MSTILGILMIPAAMAIPLWLYALAAHTIGRIKNRKNR